MTYDNLSLDAKRFINEFGTVISKRVAWQKLGAEEYEVDSQTDVMIIEALGQEIRRLREHQGLSRRELAEKAQVDRITIALLENKGIELSQVSVENIDKLITALHPEAESLLSGQRLGLKEKRLQQRIQILKTIRQRIEKITQQLRNRQIKETYIRARIDKTPKQTSLLRTIFPFSEVSEKDFRVTASCFEFEEYQEDEIIFQQGDTSQDMYVVLSGAIRIFKFDLGGKETTIDVFTTGDILGEFALIDRKPRNATAIVVSSCELLKMSSEQYFNCLESVPDLGLGMQRMLVRKLHLDATCMANIAQARNTEGKLKYVMYRKWMSTTTPSVNARKRLPFSIPDLASMLQTSTEDITYVLQKWEDQGLIAYEDGKIIILDLVKFASTVPSRVWSSEEVDRYSIDVLELNTVM